MIASISSGIFNFSADASRMKKKEASPASLVNDRLRCADLKRMREMTLQQGDLMHKISEQDLCIAALKREVAEKDKLIRSLRHGALLKQKRELKEKGPSSPCRKIQQEFCLPEVKKAGLSSPERVLVQSPSDKKFTTSRPSSSRSGSSPSQQKGAVKSEKTKRDAATRPVAPFIDYCHVNRAELKLKEPELSAMAVTRLLADQWRALSAKEQDKYRV